MVSPNPLTTGSFTLTVNGSGFASGAVVKFGSTSLTTTFVSAAPLTATGSTSTTGTVAITVVNPDGQTSPAFNLTVNGSVAVTVSVSPSYTTARLQEHDTLHGHGAQYRQYGAVTWQVNNVTGGNSATGTISSNGVYTAPAAIPSAGSVTVRAVSAADPTKSGTATVVFRK